MRTAEPARKFSGYEPVKGQILAGKCQARRRGAEANYATFFPARHANGITKRRCAKLQAPVRALSRRRLCQSHLNPPINLSSLKTSKSCIKWAMPKSLRAG